MKKRMTCWGVGPKFTVVSFIMATAVLAAHTAWFAHLKIPLPRPITLILGIVLVIVGLPVFIIPGMTIHRYFKRGELATGGVYSYIRHPIYGSWIVFIVPGFVLLMNSLIAIIIPVLMYAVFKILIVEEDRFLEGQFGERFVEYKRNVGSIFPKIRSLF